MTRQRRFKQPRGFALGELVVVVIIIGVLVLLCLPARRRAREPARRMQCKNNLRNLTLALHNYHDTHGHFPPAFTVDRQGNRLHSWRTLLLPFLDQSVLYQRIDLSKPWDHPANAAARETDLSIFRCPSAPAGPCRSCYVGVVGPDAFFKPDGTTRKMRDIVDGTTNTLAINEVSAAAAVHWMDPNDDVASAALRRSTDRRAASSHTGGFQAAMVDGSVEFVSDDVPRQTLDAYITVAGRDEADSLYP